MTPISRLMQAAPVIPVLIIDDLQHAVQIAKALVAGGLPILEVTLRTPVALEAIRAMKSVEGAVVGAGTVVDEASLDQALTAGAEFIVSPGLTPGLGRAVVATNIPFLPGVANAADIMLGLELGLSHFKFFPAVANGGIAALKALSGPFYQSRFCPTGGITAQSAPEWLALPQVLCVGGSWLVPPGEPDTDLIEALARQCTAR
jgi:2-dehydro-3-deoxyphosphogluconate aldolase/(4S)-4-hydroxy-2-oxoglutarate aldolase